MSGHRYQHIIWDWNGTLLDDIHLCILIINSLLETQELPPVSSDSYRAVFRFPVIDYYRDLGFDFSLAPFEELSTAFISAYELGRSHCQLMPGARIILPYLLENDYTQFILSASKQEYLDRAVLEYGLAELFLSQHGIDNHHAAGKLAAGRELLAAHPRNPAEFLLVGDTLHDAQVAQALGVDCCLIPNGHQSAQRLQAADVPLLGSLLDLADFLG